MGTRNLAPRVGGRDARSRQVVEDEDTVGVPASRRGIEPEEPSADVDRSLLVPHLERQVLQPHATEGTGASSAGASIRRWATPIGAPR